MKTVLKNVMTMATIPRRAGWGLLFSAFAAISAPAAEDWTRHFRLGLQVGMNISADFSFSGQFNVSGSAPGPAGVSGVDHIYDDGYVRVDDTGNAGGQTSFWGYDNASQYDSGADTLTFRSSRSFTQNGTGREEGGPQFGVDMAYGGRLGRALGGEIGWDFGFGFLPISVEDDRALPTMLVRTVHQFSTGGIVVPDAPYQGGSSGVGPTIPDVATALPDEMVAGTITGTRELDVKLFSFRLGPTMQWQLARRWSLQASLGGALGLATGEYEFNEAILLTDGSTAFNSGSIDNTEVVYGGYASALVKWRTGDQADIYVGAQYMALGNPSFDGGGRRAELRLGSGIYLLAGINWPF